MLRTKLSSAIPNPDGTREKPGFFVCVNCFWWLELCPPMPRDEKDMDEVPDSYEDHCADMTRYRLNWRSEEHTSELQSLMRISYAVFCWKKKTTINKQC